MPRHPILRNDQLQFYMKSFEENPSAFNKEMLSLCQSEEDLRRIIEVIDEKTSFDQTLDDLATIMFKILSFLKEKPEWINSWKSAMNIIRDQFENNPGRWSWILTEHAQREDIQHGIGKYYSLSNEFAVNLISIPIFFLKLDLTDPDLIFSDPSQPIYFDLYIFHFFGT